MDVQEGDEVEGAPFAGFTLLTCRVCKQKPVCSMENYVRKKKFFGNGMLVFDSYFNLHKAKPFKHMHNKVESSLKCLVCGCVVGFLLPQHTGNVYLLSDMLKPYDPDRVTSGSDSDRVTSGSDSDRVTSGSD